MTIFIGKWSFVQGTNNVFINTSGVLGLGATPGAGDTHFNAYGSAAGFSLQGPNGLFVAPSNGGYAAIRAATDPLTLFTLENDNAGNVRVVDLGINGAGATQYYWNVSGTTLTALPKTGSPPATTLFQQTIVTPGIETILAEGFSSPQPDLVWVNIAGTDFRTATGIIDFTQSNLAHADLSNTIFDPGTAFDGSSGPYANFTRARLADCSIGSSSFPNSIFTSADMRAIQLDGSDFSNAVMTSANMRSAGNLAHAKFIGATLRFVDFTDTGNILDTDFTNADLTGALFTGASVTGTMTISGANLTDAALNNPKDSVTIFPGFIVLDGKTNFTGAYIQYLDFTGYTLNDMIFTGADATGCKFTRASMIGIDMAFATLDYADFTGTVLLHGANLSNASLKGADLTNAQLGALSARFAVASGSPNYTKLLNGLKDDNTVAVQQVFADNGYTLAGTITITPSSYSQTSWTVQATAPQPQSYTIQQQSIGGTPTLVVYTVTTPAVLSNAFMVSVKLTAANMIGVNASGASIYGIAGVNPDMKSALLQDAQFSNANLSNADFSSANMGGVSFDYAILTNSIFQNAQLITSSSGTRASFIGTNLQSTKFDGATIANVAFTNAAVCVANPANPAVSAGVWLFDVPQEAQALILPELEAAATGQFTLANQALDYLQTPGVVSPVLINAFKAKNVTLTDDAILSVMGSGLYWQLADGATKYVIFQSYQSSTYAPALGVNTGTAYTTTAKFYLPLSIEKSLKNGTVDPVVVAAFKAAGHPISRTSQITVAQHPTDWQIINGAPTYAVYSLWLAVMSNAGLTITVRPAIPNLIAAFNASSIALTQRATITALSTKNGWSVSNGAEDPYNPVKNYITFNMIQSTAPASFSAYGAVMRIARLKAPGELAYFNITAGLTNLTQEQLSAPGNVCPNGDFAKTNLTNGLPFAQWLRASAAPRPPQCIPDPGGFFACPR